MPSATSPDLPATWRRFLTGVDALLPRSVRLHCQHAGVVSLPESYAERLTELLPDEFAKWIEAYFG
jgi:hypothetical protein